MRAKHRHIRNFGVSRYGVAVCQDDAAMPPWTKSTMLLALLAAAVIGTIVGVVWLATLLALFMRTLFDFSHAHALAGARWLAQPRNAERRTLAG